MGICPPAGGQNELQISEANTGAPNLYLNYQLNSLYQLVVTFTLHCGRV